MWRRSKSSSSFSRVVTQIIMLFAIGVASPSRSIHVCVMAFRNIVRSDMKRQHQLLSSARIAPTKESVVTRYDNTFLPDYSIRSGASRFMSTKYSIHEEDGDYNSMTVSDLRELLRQRGLAISGIKAQLVERLESGEINPGKIGSRQKLPRNNEMKKSNRMRSVEDRANIDQGDKNETRDDLAGLVNHLKSLEAGNDAKTDPKRATIQDLNRRTGPKNLVFAKGGEEDSDDEWGDDEDYEEEDDDSDNDDNDIDDYDIDPNTTSRAPPINRSKSVGDTTSFKEDFQGTRVFVQGLPEEATWKDVSYNASLNLVDYYSTAYSHIRLSMYSSAQRSFQPKHCWRSCVCIS